MNLARHSITSTSPIQINDARFDADAHIFTATTPSGFAVYRTWPLKLLRKREFTAGTLATVLPLHTSSLLFLLGGGRSPLYPPNKVVIWDDALGKEVAELEFRERVRGMACRRGWLVVALRRRAIAFQIGEQATRFQEWDTCDNQRGLVAIATAAHSTVLAIAGRQTGHVQLIQLPPCSPPVPRSPPSPTLPRGPPPKPTKHSVSIIVAHTTSLTALALLPSGRLLATTSTRGTLVRVWDTHSGKLLREFRRGTDKADIYGVAFRPDERELCVWSDKGTVHVFSLAVGGTGSSNRHSALSPLAPFVSLPKYFDSEWSFAQYRIPSRTSHISLSSGSKLSEVAESERCVVAWIQPPGNDSGTIEQGSNMEYQLIVLTHSGGWYRLSLPYASSTKGTAGSTTQSTASVRGPSWKSPPRARSSSGSSMSPKVDKGKDRQTEVKEGRDCILQEFRRYGRWDGWG